MSRSLLAIGLAGILGAALLTMGLQTIPSTPAVFASAGSPQARTVMLETSLLANKHEYRGYVYHGEQWQEIVGYVPGNTPRDALVLALVIEARIAAVIDKARRAAKRNPRGYPSGAYLDDLVYRSDDRHRLKRRYDIGIGITH